MNLVFKRMAEGYTEQVPHYEKMMQLAMQQKAVLETEEVDVQLLLNLIEQRQELIAVLGKMNEGLVSLKKEIEESLGITEFNISNIKKELSGPGVEALEVVLERLGDILGKIKELDQANEKALRQTMQKTQEQLRSIQEQKKVDKAYQPSSFADEGIFIDYSK